MYIYIYICTYLMYIYISCVYVHIYICTYLNFMVENVILSFSLLFFFNSLISFLSSYQILISFLICVVKVETRCLKRKLKLGVYILIFKQKWQICQVTFGYRLETQDWLIKCSSTKLQNLSKE